MGVGAKAIVFLAQDRFPRPWPASEATLAEADEPHQAGAKEADRLSVVSDSGYTDPWLAGGCVCVGGWEESAARPQIRIDNVNIRTIRDIVLSFFKSVFASWP